MPTLETDKLSTALDLLSKLANRDLAYEVRKVYVRQLESVPFDKLKAAFVAFGSEGRWPTVRQLLDAAGVSATPVEKTIRVDATALDPESTCSPKVGSPIVVWEMFAHNSGEDEREADMVFGKFSHRLELAGWNVTKLEKYRIKTDANTEINGILYKNATWLWKALFSSIK